MILLTGLLRRGKGDRVEELISIPGISKSFLECDSYGWDDGVEVSENGWGAAGRYLFHVLFVVLGPHVDVPVCVG